MFYSLGLSLLDGSRWSVALRKSGIFFFFLCLYLPWITVVLLSFAKAQEKGEVSSDLWKLWESFTTENYPKLFSLSQGDNDSFWKSLCNSFAIAISAIVPSMWISLMSAFAIWKRGGKMKSIIFKISNLSISSPELIQGLSFFLLFSAVFLPMKLNFGFGTIILAHIAFLVPYGIILIYPKLEKINKRVLLASYDLNCAELETLYKIVVPQLKGTLVFTSLVMLILSMDDFIITSLVRGRINTLTTQLYTMKKGVKAWALTFGSLLFMFSALIFIAYSFATSPRVAPKLKLKNQLLQLL